MVNEVRDKIRTRDKISRIFIQKWSHPAFQAVNFA